VRYAPFNFTYYVSISIFPKLVEFNPHYLLNENFSHCHVWWLVRWVIDGVNPCKKFVNPLLVFKPRASPSNVSLCPRPQKFSPLMIQCTHVICPDLSAILPLMKFVWSFSVFLFRIFFLFFATCNCTNLSFLSLLLGCFSARNLEVSFSTNFSTKPCAFLSQPAYSFLAPT